MDGHISPSVAASRAEQRQPIALVDALGLGKPRIVLMCLITTVAGMSLAPSPVAWLPAVMALLGTGLAAFAASTLNMYLERDVDRLMQRTCRRPLPAGRLAPPVALAIGTACAAGSIVVLWTAVNPLTALLAAFAIDTYVLLYTPLKRTSPWALLVGAVPGAMPPLIGWTAMTGSIGGPGLAIFGTMTLWQIPHFIAIALYRQRDYARAGLQVLPVAHGAASARRCAWLGCALLIPVSLVPAMLGVAGWAYAVIVGLASIAFFVSGIIWLSEKSGNLGAKRFFLASLAYVPLLGLALMLNAALG